MPNVLVTHSDEPLGRRVVKLLWHDDRIGKIVALGSGAAPRAFDAFQAGAPPRFGYAHIDRMCATPDTVNGSWPVTFYPQSAKISKDGSLVAAGFDDGSVRIWQSDSEEETSCLPGHTDAVT